MLQDICQTHSQTGGGSGRRSIIILVREHRPPHNSGEVWGWRIRGFFFCCQCAVRLCWTEFWWMPPPFPTISTLIKFRPLACSCSLSHSEVLAYASVYFRNTFGALGSEMSPTECSFVMVLLIFLAHVFLLDETCPLRTPRIHSLLARNSVNGFGSRWVPHQIQYLRT